MKKQPSSGVDRRSFLTGVGAAGAAGAAAAAAKPSSAAEPAAASPPGASSAEAARRIAAVEQTPEQPAADQYHVRNAGSDFMVDVLRGLGYEYVIACPGSTFRGLQESVISYAMNSRPEWITAAHEDISAGIAHGYAKAAGKPAAIMVHNTVGLQHAMMGIFNAWADRAPMMVITGNYGDAALRLPGADWMHSAVDDAVMLQGMIKYNDQPASLTHFAESMARAHGLMLTPPMGPVFMVADGKLQEDGFASYPQVKPFVAPGFPAANAGDVEQIAKMLVAAKEPVLIVDRVGRTPADVANLVTLAELLQAPVLDRLGRMNFPTNHYLWSDESVLGEADMLLALDVGDLFSVVASLPDRVNRVVHSRIKPDAKIASIDSQLLASSGTYQDKERFVQVDVPVAADAAASLPSLIEAVQRAMPAARRAENPGRADRLRAAFSERREEDLREAAVGWDYTPISVPRMCMEVYHAVKRYDWSLVSLPAFQGLWPQRLWDFTQHHQFIGGQGGDGVGYMGCAAVGAALAHRSDGVLPVTIQGDGDFLMGPAAMWTAAHHKLPLLIVIHNNRAWHNETMKVQLVAGMRDRHPERGTIGTVLTDPNIDYARIAQGLGVYAERPITDPADLGPALARAVKVVRSGHPALVDVVSSPR